MQQLAINRIEEKNYNRRKFVCDTAIIVEKGNGFRVKKV